ADELLRHAVVQLADERDRNRFRERLRGCVAFQPGVQGAFRCRADGLSAGNLRRRLSFTVKRLSRAAKRALFGSGIVFPVITTVNNYANTNKRTKRNERVSQLAGGPRSGGGQGE